LIAERGFVQGVETEDFTAWALSMMNNLQQAMDRVNVFASDDFPLKARHGAAIQ